MSKVGTPKTTGSTLTAEQHNAFLVQNERIIPNAGGTLEINDTIQYGQAIVSHIAIATFFTDDGVVANSYVLNPQGAFDTPIDNITTWNGMLIRFRPNFTNTGASTVAFAGLNGGVPINILREDGSAILSGDILSQKDTFIRYDLTLNAFLLIGSYIKSRVDLNTANITTNSNDILTLQNESVGYPQVFGARPIFEYVEPALNPAMTANADLGYIASASTVQGGNDPFQSFDKDFTTGNNGWRSQTNAGDPQWIRLQFPQPEYIRTVRIVNEVTTPSNFENGIIQGSNDGVVFDDLLTITGRPNIAGYDETYFVNSAIQYTYFRLEITLSRGGESSIQEIELTFDQGKLNNTEGYFVFNDNSGSAFLPAGSFDLYTNGLNGLDVGNPTSSIEYKVFGIHNPTTLQTALLASISDIPTLPAGYTQYIVLQKFITNASGGFERFYMYENEPRTVYYRNGLNEDFDGSNFTTPTLIAIRAPANSFVKFNYYLLDGNIFGVLFNETKQDEQILLAGINPYTQPQLLTGSHLSNIGTDVVAGTISIHLDENKEIRVATSPSDGATTRFRTSIISYTI